MVNGGGRKMSLEKRLIEKTYFEMFINEQEQVSPVRVLGEAYQAELQKDIPELSNIRFAQGEVYFHHKDFETAIFKWEHVINELEPWAKKNIADAFFETGLLPNAEDQYLSIITDDATLKTEVAMKLFFLYIQRGKLHEAVETIKNTITANPDYPNVTETARQFFEKHSDWENAVELALKEAKRTGSGDWYRILKGYIEIGATKNLHPQYFSQALVELFGTDRNLFEDLAASLWNSYREEDSYFTWLKEFNYLLFNLDIERQNSWQQLSGLHKDTYYSLIGGQLSIKKIEEVVPDLLTNWQRLAVPAHRVLASAAVMSWNELFPGSISAAITAEAEKLIGHTEHHLDEFEECLGLFETIIDWGKQNDMGENNRLKWTASQLVDLDTHHLMLAGFSGSGKSSFVNNILGEALQDGPTSSLVLFKHNDEQKITEVCDHKVTELSGFADFQERMDRRRNAMDSYIEYKQPFSFLLENKLAFLDTPGLNGSQVGMLPYLQLADTILFVLDANEPFTDKERAALAEIQRLAPDTPIHFLLNKLDTLANEQDAVTILTNTEKEIAAFYPESVVLTEKDGLQNVIQVNQANIKIKRLAKLLYYIRTTITTLLQKRIDVENKLIESVRWNEEILKKLNGGINQLKDAESEKTTLMRRSYQAIKDGFKKEITEAIPKLLKGCAELISEKSDFSKIHLELNQEMNQRMQDYLEVDVLPRYFTALLEWIGQSRVEFEQTQAFLGEMSTGFNQIFGEEKLKLACDFKILDDWRRDTDRMTSRFHLETVNILLRRTPSQMLLKGAGKLLGALSQNKTMLSGKYKAFVENDDYTEIVNNVSERFFQQFELFENALERDISLFFKDPEAILEKAAGEARAEIENGEDILKKMNTNPELFRDPLTLFEIRLRQFEWLTVAGKGLQTIY
jgi:GTPase SAR1 family protein